MRTYQAVTSFSAEGKVLYGDRMVGTFAMFWPREVSLQVYADEDLPPWLHQFKARHAGNPAAHGRARGYDFRRDAVKFAHKTAAIIDAFECSSADVLIWLDADTVTHAPLTMSDLDAFLPAPSALAWLSRIGGYPETGFLMFDRGHAAIGKLVADWCRLYETDSVFGLPQWHDAFVLQHLVTNRFLPWVSLSGDACAHSHPMINGPLGKWFDHLKGPRKKEGKSRPSDLKVQREEAYWR